jgi:ABC-type sugar transport system substrate-binding protein
MLGHRRARTGALRLALTVVVGSCAIGILAGCGSSDSGGGGTATAGSADAATSSEAARVANLAQTKLLYGPTTGMASAAQLRAPKPGDISAYPYKLGGPKRSVAIISCAPISGQCTHTAEITKAYLAKIGIGGTVVQSDYTPAGNQRAMNTALSQHPDAIILYAVAPSTIGPQIAKAKAAKIPVVDGIGTSALDKGNLDAYVPQGSNLYQIAAGAQMAVAGGKNAKIHWLSAPEFPQLEVEPGVAFLKEVCPGCDVSTGTETAAQVTDPVKMGALVTSNIRAHAGLKYLALASACADLQSAAAAARQTGTVQVTAGGCGASAIAAMNSKTLPFATSSIEPWSALASIDQVLRLWGGKPPLPETKTGPAAYLVTPQSTPDTSTKATYGKLDRWALQKFDFVAPYSKAWGVDLSDVIANEK